MRCTYYQRTGSSPSCDYQIIQIQLKWKIRIALLRTRNYRRPDRFEEVRISYNYIRLVALIAEIRYSFSSNDTSRRKFEYSYVINIEIININLTIDVRSSLLATVPGEPSLATDRESLRRELLHRAEYRNYDGFLRALIRSLAEDFY